MTLRIMIADDHAAFRGRLAARLQGEPGLSVVAQADGGRSALALLAAGLPALPDLLVLDVDLRDLGGLDVLRQIRHLHPKLRVLMLSWHDDAALVRAVLEAGGMGYVHKDDAFTELPRAVREIEAGRTFISAALGNARISGD